MLHVNKMMTMAVICIVAGTVSIVSGQEACKDSDGQFTLISIPSKVGTRKQCSWVRRANTATKCSYPEVKQACPFTCQHR